MKFLYSIKKIIEKNGNGGIKLYSEWKIELAYSLMNITLIVCGGVLMVTQVGSGLMLGVYIFLAGTSSACCYYYCKRNKIQRNKIVWFASVLVCWYLFWFLIPLDLFGPKVLKTPILIFSKVVSGIFFLIMAVAFVAMVLGIDEVNFTF